MDNLTLGDRHSGKTEKLIEECANDNYSIIVCPTREMCLSTYNRAIEMRLSIPMPITFEEFIRGKWQGRFVDNFYFDELQMSLEHFARGTNISDVVMDVTNSEIEDLRSNNRKTKDELLVTIINELNKRGWITEEIFWLLSKMREDIAKEEK